MYFSRNSTSEVIFVRLAANYKIFALRGYFNLQAIYVLLCVFGKDNFKEDFWQINWKAITITYSLNDSLSMANK